jgi:hypothetical protein
VIGDGSNISMAVSAFGRVGSLSAIHGRHEASSLAQVTADRSLAVMRRQPFEARMKVP